jgi:hypothetical protein
MSSPVAGKNVDFPQDHYDRAFEFAHTGSGCRADPRKENRLAPPASPEKDDTNCENHHNTKLILDEPLLSGAETAGIAGIAGIIAIAANRDPGIAGIVEPRGRSAHELLEPS